MSYLSYLYDEKCEILLTTKERGERERKREREREREERIYIKPNTLMRVADNNSLLM